MSCLIFFSSLGNQEVEDLELDDAELLASLEAQEEVEMVLSDPAQDSGYGTISANSTHSSRRSSVRSLVSTASSRWVGNNIPQHLDAGTPQFSLSGKYGFEIDLSASLGY